MKKKTNKEIIYIITQTLISTLSIVVAACLLCSKGNIPLVKFLTAIQEIEPSKILNLGIWLFPLVLITNSIINIVIYIIIFKIKKKI